MHWQTFFSQVTHTPLLSHCPLKPPPQPPPPTALPPQVTHQLASYSAVNVLGLLPEELRTHENLEGQELPEDQQEEFMKQCLKKQRYSEQEVNRQEGQPSQQGTPKPAATGTNMKVRSISPPGYEDVPEPLHADDDY